MTNKKILKLHLENKILKQIKNWNMPNHLSGFILRSIHFHSPIYCYLLLLLLPRYYGFYAIIPLILAGILYLYLGGCILTRVEHKLLNDEMTIIDPLISLCNDRFTHTNRYYYTLYLALIYFTIVFFTMIYKGYFTIK